LLSALPGLLLAALAGFLVLLPRLVPLATLLTTLTGLLILLAGLVPLAALLTALTRLLVLAALLTALTRLLVLLAALLTATLLWILRAHRVFLLVCWRKRNGLSGRPFRPWRPEMEIYLLSFNARPWRISSNTVVPHLSSASTT
jgi:hypothetical protein